MTKKILVVEDDRLVNQEIKYELERGGYQVTTALNIKQAEIFIRTELFDVLVTDTSLTRDTTSTEGVEVSSIFMKKNNQGKVIAISNIDRDCWKRGENCDTFIKNKDGKSIQKELAAILGL